MCARLSVCVRTYVWIYVCIYTYLYCNSLNGSHSSGRLWVKYFDETRVFFGETSGTLELRTEMRCLVLNIASHVTFFLAFLLPMSYTKRKLTACSSLHKYLSHDSALHFYYSEIVTTENVVFISSVVFFFFVFHDFSLLVMTNWTLSISSLGPFFEYLNIFDCLMLLLLLLLLRFVFAIVYSFSFFWCCLFYYFIFCNVKRCVLSYCYCISDIFNCRGFVLRMISFLSFDMVSLLGLYIDEF